MAEKYYAPEEEMAGYLNALLTDEWRKSNEWHKNGGRHPTRQCCRLAESSTTHACQKIHNMTGGSTHVSVYTLSMKSFQWPLLESSREQMFFSFLG
jgi:hypothetical protein